MSPMQSQTLEVPLDALIRIEGLYHRGLFVQAHRAAMEIGPLHLWSGPEALLLAGRLARHLGGTVLGRWLIRRAWHCDPNHAKARFYYACYVAESRGPYAAWRWMHAIEQSPATGMDDTILAEWHALRAEVAAMLRDFDAAETWMRRAVALAPENPWLEVCRSMILDQEDRYEESLAAARRGLDLQPWYCPAVERAAHLLTLLDRDREAASLLEEALSRTEAWTLAAQLLALQFEFEDYRAAEQTYRRVAELAPLADKGFRRWLAGVRSDLAYYLGDLSGAIHSAKEAGPGFHATLAKHLEALSPGDAKSARLPVGFVRQHRMTCGPATLSAISRYWSKPADHLEVAEAICYNGTSAYSERRWADTHGWATREFTVTEASAAALLDRGVPFTFTTVDPASAHLQAVIGYDRRRGTFWIRDPFWRYTQEALSAELLKRYAAHGPRGMAMAPREEQSRLDGLDLPDAALWDRLHALDDALTRHCREEAESICKELEAVGDGHRIRHEARHRMAMYDADAAGRLAALEQWLVLTPEDPCLELARLACLRTLAHRDERVAVYERLCAKRKAHPVFLQQYAQELQADARRRPVTVDLLRRAIRRLPTEAGNYYILAGVRWDEHRYDEAWELYRFAACLNDREEHFAESLFTAAQWLKRTEETFKFLRGRFARFGKKSSLPARTLAHAYMLGNRNAEALTVLEEAMRLRPDDGELQLFAAETYVACSSENMPRALGLLEKAQGAAPPVEWILTAARLAARDGRPVDALALWRELLEIQPLSVDAHQAVARLLAETEGRPRALAHLSEAVDRFPHHQPLHQLWLQWMAEEPAEAREAALRRAVELFPDDAWLRREIAFFLKDERRPIEAWQEAETAARLEPASPASHFLRAELLRDDGKIDDAKAALREAVRLAVDYTFAVDEWMDLCTTAAQRRETLAFIKSELVRQVTFGDGLLAFRSQAQGTLPAEELNAVLTEALGERPDLWHAWSACTQQLLAMDRRDEAWEMACRATERFPLLPPLWLDRASACRARQDESGEREALETAHQIRPDWGSAVRSLAAFYEDHGESDRARRLLEQAVGRQPLEVDLQTMLAEWLWHHDERESALERIRRAVELGPGYERGWQDLNAWAAQLDRKQFAVDVARNLARTRGGEPRSWLLLADALDADDQREERLAALDKAIQMNPRLVRAHELRATALADAGRWDEARQACRPAVWGEHPPTPLRACAATIEARQGNLPEAIAQMGAALDEDPAYFAGWSQLWDWRRDTKDYAGCVAAAEAMVRINPQYEVAYGYLGESRRLVDDVAGARAAFQRAFDLEPRYDYAGLLLFDIELEAGDLEAAATTIERLDRHAPSPFAAARAAQLAARRGDEAAAADRLGSVCTTACDSPWPVSASVEAMAEAGWGLAAERVLEASLTVEGAPPEVGKQWVRLCTARRRWSCGRRLRELAARGDLGVEAAVQYLHALADGNRRWRFGWFVRRHRGWIHADTRTWAMVGYALAGFRRYDRAAQWLADWRQRKDVQPWMLLNLVEALRCVGRDDEAREAGRFALSLPPDDACAAHRAWLAAADACHGQIEDARKLLAQIDGASLNADGTFLKTLAESVVAIASAAAADRPDVFCRVRCDLAAAVRGYPAFRREPARRRLFRKCIARVARYRGGLAALLWRWNQWVVSQAM